MEADRVARNKATFLRLQQEVICGGRLELVDEIFDPAYVTERSGMASLARLAGASGGAETEITFDRFKAAVTYFRQVFPNQQRTIDEIGGEGDLVWARWTVRTRHQAPFLGVAPRGQPIEFTETGCVRFNAAGRIVSGWFLCNELDVLEQLGGRATLPVG